MFTQSLLSVRGSHSAVVLVNDNYIANDSVTVHQFHSEKIRPFLHRADSQIVTDKKTFDDFSGFINTLYGILFSITAALTVFLIAAKWYWRSGVIGKNGCGHQNNKGHDYY